MPKYGSVGIECAKFHFCPTSILHSRCIVLSEMFEFLKYTHRVLLIEVITLKIMKCKENQNGKWLKSKGYLLWKPRGVLYCNAASCLLLLVNKIL